jgi:hypothetical protein
MFHRPTSIYHGNFLASHPLGLPLVGAQAKAGQGLKDGVDVDERGRRTKS